MKKLYLLIFFINICFHLLAFKLEENPKSWAKEDFIGFDPVDAKIGPDLTTVFEKQIEDENYIRLQFLDFDKLNNQYKLQLQINSQNWINVYPLADDNINVIIDVPINIFLLV